MNNHANTPDTQTLKTLLEKSGLKTRRAAEIYGTSYEYFRLILCGARPVNQEKLNQLREAVGANLNF